MQSDVARHAWAAWLIGCVIMYGVLPRLIAFLLTFWLWKQGLESLRLDLRQAGFAILRARLHVSTQNIGITDPAPTALSTSRFQSWPAHEHTPTARPALVGLELGSDIRWPPAGAENFTVFPRIETREERQRLLASLQSAPPASLLIAIDTRLSPDRGSLHTINQWAQHSVTPLVWLMQSPGAQNARSGVWRESLRATGWPQDALLDDAAARIWLRAPI
jgi:hypothetical protein